MIIEEPSERLTLTPLVQKIRLCLQRHERVYWDKLGQIRVIPNAILANFLTLYDDHIQAFRQGVIGHLAAAVPIPWQEDWCPMPLGAISLHELIRVQSSRPRLDRPKRRGRVHPTRSALSAGSTSGTSSPRLAP